MQAIAVPPRLAAVAVAALLPLGALAAAPDGLAKKKRCKAGNETAGRGSHRHPAEAMTVAVNGGRGGRARALLRLERKRRLVRKRRHLHGVLGGLNIGLGRQWLRGGVDGCHGTSFLCDRNSSHSVTTCRGARPPMVGTTAPKLTERSG